MIASSVNDPEIDYIPNVRVKVGQHDGRMTVPKFKSPIKYPDPNIKIVPYVSDVYPGNASSFSWFNEEKTQYSYDPKKKDIGVYPISFLVKTKNPLYPYTKEYHFMLEVYDEPDPDQGLALGERVQFKIIDITRNGSVNVMLKQSVTDINLIRMLTNETVNFYVSKYDRTEYRNSPA
jgi:hypothetical protein